MQLVETIIAALTAGATAEVKNIGSEVVKNLYSRLKTGVAELFQKSSDEDGLAALNDSESDWDGRLPRIRGGLLSANDQDLRLLAELAQGLMAAMPPRLSQTGYSLSVAGNVGNVVQGSNATVNITVHDATSSGNPAS